jgi:hypothetical protein
MWVDPDLGCYLDDYIGCDTAKRPDVRSQSGCYRRTAGRYLRQVPGHVRRQSANSSVLTTSAVRSTPLVTSSRCPPSCTIIMVDSGRWPAATTDPSQPGEVYKDFPSPGAGETVLCCGDQGSGYGAGNETNTCSLTRRMIRLAGVCVQQTLSLATAVAQASGPFTLLPGAINELIIGVPWVPDIDYPCPDVEGLFRADKLARPFQQLLRPARGPQRSRCRLD